MHEGYTNPADAAPIKSIIPSDMRGGNNTLQHFCPEIPEDFKKC